jgi:photosystem II stability/assembly factor-like uncharacterized protein
MVERTIDGGATWSRMDLGASVPQVLVSLRVVSIDQTDAVVRRAGDCSVSVSASFTGGEFWADFPERLGEQVYPDPLASASVRVGFESVSVPCSGVIDVWSDPGGIVALCPDLVTRYDSAAGSWLTLTSGNVLAAAMDSANGSGLLALAGTGRCEGVQIEAFDESSTVEQRACLEDMLVGDRATLAVTGSDAWIWSGAGVLASEDGGLTWARVG